MRGMQRARLLFCQYLIFTATSLTGLVIGAERGLRGATWGLTIGAAVGLVVMIALYLWAATHLLPSPDPAPTPTSPADLGKVGASSDSTTGSP
jgi:hypothetical protein